jgi:hypothetical protein
LEYSPDLLRFVVLNVITGGVERLGSRQCARRTHPDCQAIHSCKGYRVGVIAIKCAFDTGRFAAQRWSRVPGKGKHGESKGK